MTGDNIKAKALVLLNEVRAERGWVSVPTLYRTDVNIEALCRAIERHEAFKQEVSDAVEKAQTPTEILCLCGRKNAVAFIRLDQFIIPKPKPDPLVAAMEKMGWYIAPNGPADAENFRAALDALGFEIREKE